MKKTREMMRISGAVEEFLVSKELAVALRPHRAKVFWAEIVGPQVAAVTQTEAVRNGVLVVRVKNSVWANELTLLKEDMLYRLNRKLGGRIVTDIHFKAGGLIQGKEPLRETERTREITAPTELELAKIAVPKEALARIDASLAAITEDTMRGRIRQIMFRAARTEEWKRTQGWQVCVRCGSLAAPPFDFGAPVLCALCRAGASSR